VSDRVRATGRDDGADRCPLDRSRFANAQKLQVDANGAIRLARTPQVRGTGYTSTISAGAIRSARAAVSPRSSAIRRQSGDDICYASRYRWRRRWAAPGSMVARQGRGSAARAGGGHQTHRCFP
jgi:hypothetical protein